MDDRFQTLNTRFRLVIAQFDHTDAKSAYDRDVRLVDTRAIRRTESALKAANAELMRAEIAARDYSLQLEKHSNKVDA